MSDTRSTASEWPRPNWSAGDEHAVLLFFVFGTFAKELRIPAARHGSKGLPAGVELFRYPRETLEQWEGFPLHGALGEMLRQDHPTAFEAAMAAPEVLSVRGRLEDAASLDYLRDTLGVIAGLMDIGGVAVADPQILSLFDQETWQDRFMVEGGAPPRHHVLILCNEDEDAGGGMAWVRTRGMRKFGRPDISIRGVPHKQADAAGELCLRLVEMQVMGTHFSDGQELEIEGLPDVLKARRGGSLDDPHFNNTHVELVWPK
ncbi:MULTISPECIES: hypothetical protein [Oleiagrimonas]|uniref:DUF4261 domain-containing protein n=1 Tax=Oleiagrimonas citrea TaxID=1665687 RepID=A0A846ZQ46_9GAMM|nr:MULTISPECIES: hypothetical protein [Oleiagrimonas]NKZ39777.1 hypothetical protein [Oleiagrimonas citrea]RAP57217.1 hypothetical protein BTJ49_11765 [Oleiagrimonas sp. MCCC 1A03011]